MRRSASAHAVRRAILLPAALACSLVAACSVRSPASEVKDVLGGLARVEVADAGGALLDLERVRFADLAVSMDGPRALVIAMVEAEGRARWEGREPALSYVGREAFAMERCPGKRWCPVGTPLPALRGVVGALTGAPRPPGVRVIAWQIRIERGKALVGEDREAPGGRTRVRHEVVLSGGRWALRPEP